MTHAPVEAASGSSRKVPPSWPPPLPLPLPPEHGRSPPSSPLSWPGGGAPSDGQGGFAWSDVPVFDGAGVAVGLIVATAVGVGVGAGVAVGGGVGELVGRGVFVGRGVGTGVATGSGVGDGRAVADGRGVRVGVGLDASVGAALFVGAAVGAVVGRTVGLAVGPAGVNVAVGTTAMAEGDEDGTGDDALGATGGLDGAGGWTEGPGGGSGAGVVGAGVGTTAMIGLGLGPGDLEASARRWSSVPPTPSATEMRTRFTIPRARTKRARWATDTTIQALLRGLSGWVQGPSDGTRGDRFSACRGTAPPRQAHIERARHP